MTTRPCRPKIHFMAVAAGLSALAGLAAFGIAGWLRHGETLWLAMADGAWVLCF